MQRYICLLFVLLLCSFVTAKDFDIRDYGAKGDGKTNDRCAIDDAIDACSAAFGNGQTNRVVFSNGTFLTTTIHLKSNVTIYIKQDALILGAQEGYDAFELNPCQPREFFHKRFEGNYQDFGHSHFRNSVFYGRGLKNVHFEGEGPVDYTYVDLDTYPHHIHIDARACRSGNFVPSGLADKCFCIVESRNVSFKNLNAVGGGHFTFWIKDCDFFSVDNCWFDGERDGFNIGDCRNVRVTRTFMDSVDDAFCLKSDYSTCRKLYTENVLFDHCIAKTRCYALKFGASESYNAFRNVTYSNIQVVEGGKGGIGILDGQGADLENITFKNITLENCNQPIFVTVGHGKHHMNPADNGPGKIRNLRFENITIRHMDPHSRSSIKLEGNDEKGEDGQDGVIEGVTIKNLKLTLNGDELKLNPNRKIPGWVKFDNVQWAGLYAKHVKGLTVENISYDFVSKNTKPLILLENVRDARFMDIHSANFIDVDTDVVLRDVTGFRDLDKKLRVRTETE